MADDDNDWANLSEIIERPDASIRVVSFGWMADDHRVLGVAEECDEYFGESLTPVEVDRLIAWLTARRAEMTEGPG